MTVWVLWVSIGYFDDGIVGIYASREDAEAADAQRWGRLHDERPPHITEHVIGQTDPLWVR